MTDHQNSFKISPPKTLYFPFIVSPTNCTHKIILWNQCNDKAIQFYFDIWNRNYQIRNTDQEIDTHSDENSHSPSNLLEVLDNSFPTSENISVEMLEKKNQKQQKQQHRRIGRDNTHKNAESSQLISSDNVLVCRMNQEHFQSRLYRLKNMNGYSGIIGPGECTIIHLERRYTTVVEGYTEKIYMDWNFVERSSLSDPEIRESALRDPISSNKLGFKLDHVYRQEWICHFDMLPQSLNLQASMELDGLIVSRGDEELLEKQCGKRHYQIFFSPPDLQQYKYPLHQLYVHPETYKLVLPEQVIKKPFAHVCTSCKLTLMIKETQKISPFSPTVYYCTKCFDCPLCGAILIPSIQKDISFYYCGYCKWTSAHLENGAGKDIEISALFPMVLKQASQTPRGMEQERSTSHLYKEVIQQLQEYKNELQKKLVKDPHMNPLSFLKGHDFANTRNVNTHPSKFTASIDEICQEDLSEVKRRTNKNYNYASNISYKRRVESPNLSSNDILKVYPLRKAMFPKFKLYDLDNKPFGAEDDDADEVQFSATHFFPTIQMTHIPNFSLFKEAEIRFRIVNPNQFGLRILMKSTDSSFNSAKCRQNQIEFILHSDNEIIKEDPSFTNHFDPSIVSIQSDAVEVELSITPLKANFPIRIEFLLKLVTLDDRKINSSYRVYFDFGFIVL